jgi:hypothetical protein
MTERHTEGVPAHGKVRSEEDRVPALPVVSVGIAALVVFFLASLVTITYLRGREAERPFPPVPPEIGQSKIGLVEQQLFESADRGERDRAERLKRLGSFAWVDRRRGIVRIPIDLAMELTARGVRPQVPSPGGARPEAQP